jgi:hypothetical protein
MPDNVHIDEDGFWEGLTDISEPSSVKGIPVREAARVANEPVEALGGEPEAYFTDSGAVRTGIPDILPDHLGVSFEDLSGKSPTAFLTGPAGSGKTFTLKQAIAADPQYAMLTATTGIAAVNLGENVRTIHSTCRCGTVRDFEHAFVTGALSRALREVKKEGVRWIVVDEVSMLHSKILKNLVFGLDYLNDEDPESGPLGLLLTGDFAQLPPIPDAQLDEKGRAMKKLWRGKMIDVKEPTPWAFESEFWERFEKNTIRLTKIWRQDGGPFLDALGYIRRGNGEAGVRLLKEAGVRFTGALDMGFNGTTIVAKNDEVDRYNESRLFSLPGKALTAISERWSAKVGDKGGVIMPGEWKQIPESFQLKEGALVMILRNETETFSYVNGDTGIVKQLEVGEKGTVVKAHVELFRTGRVVEIEKVSRFMEQKAKPEKEELERDQRVRQEKVYNRNVWILGECKYLPLRVAYATSVHKSQGLTLDQVQIDPSAHFFGNPGMAYVALSRCRTPEGLVIVGDADRLVRRVKVEPVLQRRGFL